MGVVIKPFRVENGRIIPMDRKTFSERYWKNFEGIKNGAGAPKHFLLRCGICNGYYDFESSSVPEKPRKRKLNNREDENCSDTLYDEEKRNDSEVISSAHITVDGDGGVSNTKRTCYDVVSNSARKTFDDDVIKVGTTFDSDGDNVDGSVESKSAVFSNAELEELTLPEVGLEIESSGPCQDVTAHLQEPQDKNILANSDVPCEESDATWKNLEVPCEESDATCENLEVPCEESDATCENLDVPCEESDMTCENLNVPFEESDVTCENLDVPFEESDATCENLDVPYGNQDEQDHQQLICAHVSDNSEEITNDSPPPTLEDMTTWNPITTEEDTKECPILERQFSIEEDYVSSAVFKGDQCHLVQRRGAREQVIERLMWCKLCDTYYQNVIKLKCHVSQFHRRESSEINRWNYATWDLEVAKSLDPPSQEYETASENNEN